MFFPPSLLGPITARTVLLGGRVLQVSSLGLKAKRNLGKIHDMIQENERMTMEKQPFEDVSPITHGDFPLSC